VTLHQDEVMVDESTVRSLLRAQGPQWADLQLSPAGAGTENTMYRLGTDLVVRIPRTADKAQPLRKEQRWLPRLAPLLPHPIPEPVLAGTPTPAFPVPWAIYRWIDGQEAGQGTVGDWAAFGAYGPATSGSAEVSRTAGAPSAVSWTWICWRSSGVTRSRCRSPPAPRCGCTTT
jgi:hypothetical protein